MISLMITMMHRCQVQIRAHAVHLMTSMKGTRCSPRALLHATAPLHGPRGFLGPFQITHCTNCFFSRAFVSLAILLEHARDGHASMPVI